MDVDVKIEVDGLILEDKYRQILDEAIDQMLLEISDEGEKQLHTIMHSSFRNATGYFESKITTMVRDKEVIIDDPVIYGPWLEGVGSRNKKSRFKGYNMFRRATQQLERTAEGIAERVLSKYVERMND